MAHRDANRCRLRASASTQISSPAGCSSRGGAGGWEEGLMSARPSPEKISVGLTVPERLLLFCLASDTYWPGGQYHARERAAHACAKFGRARLGCDELQAHAGRPRVVDGLLEKGP